MQACRVDATPRESSQSKNENGASLRRDDQTVSADLSEAAAIDIQTLLHLQRTLGNQAVAELLAQRQLPATQPTDPPGSGVLPKDVSTPDKIAVQLGDDYDFDKHLDAGAGGTTSSRLSKSPGPEAPVSAGPTGRAAPRQVDGLAEAGKLAPSDVLYLQAVAGNGAVSADLAAGRLAVQREPPPAAGAKSTAILYQGKMLTTDTAMLRATLEMIVAEQGQPAAETFAYGFLRMDFSQKTALQLRGYDPQLIEDVQHALEGVLKKLQDDNVQFLKDFEASGNELATDLLNASEKQINEERDKYISSTFGIADVKADLADKIQAAAGALVAKRRSTNVAANKALASADKQRQQQAQMPFLPDESLRKAADDDRNAWWAQEQEYATLCRTQQGQFPILAAYSWNEDGNAVERLDQLVSPGFGPRGMMLAGTLAKTMEDRLDNIAHVRSALEGKDLTVWGQERLVSMTKEKMHVSAMQDRLVRDKVAKVHEAEEERQKLIAAIAIGLGIAITVLTLGAGVATLAGAAAADVAVLQGMATGAQAFAAGMSIAAAYDSLSKYELGAAAAETDLDKAKSIAAEKPAFEWVALALLQAGLDAAAVFGPLTGAIEAAKETGDVAALDARVQQLAPAAAGSIMPRVISEADAAGTLEKAIAAEGEHFKAADLDRLRELVEQGATQDWAEAYSRMVAKGHIRPATREAVEAALGSLPANNPRYGSLAEEVIAGGNLGPSVGGFLEPRSGIIFLAEGGEAKLAARVVHEMSHGIQAVEGTQAFLFWEEFEAFSAERRFLQRLSKYGYEPSGSYRLVMEADDLELAEFIHQQYGYPIPTRLSHAASGVDEVEKAADSLMARVKKL